MHKTNGYGLYSLHSFKEFSSGSGIGKMAVDFSNIQRFVRSNQASKFNQ